MGAKISNEINEEIKKLYLEENISAEEIARKLGVSASTVRRRLKDMGIEIIRYRQAGLFKIEEVISLYNSGTPIYKIAEMFNSSQETISKKLKENGIVIKHSGVSKFNEHVFDEIDTEEKAYWLGFIYADGCIVAQNPEKNHNYAFTITLQAGDIEHLKKFNIFMNHKKMNIKMKEKIKDDKIFQYCKWDISNEHLWNTLNDYGCTPRKSLTLEFPDENIFKSKDLIRHFIRGFFDGDGCISFYNLDKRYPLASVSGTYNFINKLIEYLPEEFGTITPCSIKNCPKLFTAGYAHKKAFRLISFLYKNCTIYLDRKYEKYIYFCRSLEKSEELLESNIGEPCDGNTEIIN